LHAKGTVRMTVSLENLPNLFSLTIAGDIKDQKELLNIESIKNAKNLESLEIISVPIIQIPGFEQLTNLKNLVLKDCEIREFDDFILKLENLEWLDLRGNKDLKINKTIRDVLYEKLGLFNPPDKYLEEDLFLLFDED